MKSIVLSTGLAVLLLSVNGYAGVTGSQISAQLDKFQTQMDSVNAKISSLEKENKDLQDDVDAAETETAIKNEHSIKFNGYITSYYGAYSGTRHAGENNGFRPYRFSFIPNQQLSDSLRWLSEIEFTDAPTTKDNFGEIFLERIYVQYDLHPMFKVRIGRDFFHSTVWSDNHYPSFVLPELNPLSEKKIFGDVLDGIEIMGNTVLASLPFDYIAYAGNGNGVNGTKNVNAKNTIGMRMRLQLPIGSFSRISFAAMQGGMLTDTAVSGTNKQNAIALSYEQKFGNFSLVSQYTTGKITDANLTNTTTPSTYNLTGMYANVSYKIGDFTPWAQYDTFERGAGGTTVITKDQVISLGLQYSVSRNLKVKLEERLESQTLDGVDNANQKGSSTLASVALYY